MKTQPKSQARTTRERPGRSTSRRNRTDRGVKAVAGARASGPESISDDQLRPLVERAVTRMGAERFVRVMAAVRAALKADDLTLARRAGNACRLPSHRDLMERLLTLARKGQQAEAANTALRAGLIAYQDTLDHLYAFYDYEHDVSLTDADSDTPARPQSEGTTAAI